MRVFVCDRDHPHHGEVGTLTGEIASVLGTPTERQAIAMAPQDSTEARITEIRERLLNRKAEFFAHAPSDVEYLLGRLHEQAQEIERVNALLRVTTGHEGDGSIACGHCGHRIASDGVIEALTAEIKRAEAAESALAAAKQEIAAMSVSPVPPTIATDDDFREVYCQGYRHALSDVVKRLAELTQGHASPSQDKD